MQLRSSYAFVISAVLAVWVAHPASAMTLKECSAKFQEAKNAGSLNGLNWYAFRSAECAIDEGSRKGTDAQPAVQVAAAKVAAPAAAAGGMQFPNAIDSKYASEKPAKARLHTCADAYRVHKKAGTLNGLRWIQKGGGFYSLCNRSLKKSA